MNELAVAEPLELAPNGLRVNRTPTLDEWLAFGAKLAKIKHALQWTIGDWLNYGESVYGEKYAQALDMTQYEYGSLRNLRWVASKFELSRRVTLLSWSHHNVVSALPDDQADELLQRAVECHWTRDDLREQVKLLLPPKVDEPSAPEDAPLLDILITKATSDNGRVLIVTCEDQSAVKAFIEYVKSNKIANMRLIIREAK